MGGSRLPRVGGVEGLGWRGQGGLGWEVSKGLGWRGKGGLGWEVSKSLGW